MSASFSREFIEEIKQKMDIVSVVERHVRLERVGSRLRGVCPFHNETKPSFYVNPELGLFYCFGCQASGDVIDFYSRINGVEFPQAVMEMAEELGIKVEFGHKGEGVSKRKLFFEMNSVASGYFTQCLQQTPRAQQYLRERQLSPSVIEMFKLGYALDRWDGLKNFLSSRGYSPLEAVDAGLLLKSEKGRIYDRFRNRIIFPIPDVTGRIVGFGGRIVGEGEPKYLNSSENMIFKKGDNLYGLYHARREISRKGEVILTEGYVDVISLFQWGFSNSCGVLGTALTPNQVKRLSKLCTRAILVFDGDEAGVKAAVHSAQMFMWQGMEVSVVMLPQGEDVDSFLKERGKDSFSELMVGAQEGLAFCLHMIRLKNSPGELIRWCREFLSSFSDPALRALYLNRISRELGIGEGELAQQLKPTPAPVQRRGVVRGDGMGLGDREILRFAICYPEYIPRLEGLDLSLILKSEMARSLWEKIRTSHGDNIVASLSEEEKGFYIESLFLREREEDPQGLWDNIESFLKKKQREALLKRAREALTLAQQDGDEERVRFFLTQINSLLKGGE